METPPTPQAGGAPNPANKLFLAADHFAAGLDLGPTTRFRAVAVCRDQSRAEHARAGRREMMDRLSDRFAPLADESPSAEWAELTKLTDALLKDGKATPTPRRRATRRRRRAKWRSRGRAARSRATTACRGSSPPPLGLPGLRPGF